MTRTETLEYLQTLKELVLPVEVARNGLKNAKLELVAAKKHLRGAIITLWVFGIVMLPWWTIILGGIALYLTYRRKETKVKPALETVRIAQTILEEELNNPDYLKGKQGFPEKFYNYTSIHRLQKLITEGRVDELKEAFNLLEQQNFQETQIALQEEMHALQKDIAASSRATAIASTITAVSSVSIARSLRD